MPASIAVVDYCKGNLASVQRGLADAGYDARITDKSADILAADGIVLPGVGSFADAMTTMEESGQADALRAALRDGTPFLGICLGVHLLFDWGDEGVAEGERMKGLGILRGHIERMNAFDAEGAKHKIPHVGWNSLEFTEQLEVNPHALSLFEGVDDGSYFYFTHSYCAVPDEEGDIIGTSTHAQRFASAVARGRVFGVQCHPEKSSHVGLRVLRNFGSIVESCAD